MQILKVLFIILEVILLFNLLILVHELGHFLAARWRGLRIEKFGIWFGKAIWQKKVNGVTYCLGTIPAGGYVALPQMAPMEALEGKSDEPREELPPIPARDKIIVAFAGPLFSFSLAILFAVVVWWIGRPVSESDTTTVIGYVKHGSPAEKAGLKAGDRILRVDGYEVNRFFGVGDTVLWRVVSSTGDTIPIEVERDGRQLTIETPYTREETKFWERKSLRQIQIAPRKTPLVGKVEPNSPAALAGIRANDILREANGIPLWSPEALPDIIAQAGEGKDIRLKIQRGSQMLEATVRAEHPLYPPDFPNEDRRPLIGVVWESTGLWTVEHPGPVQQVVSSVNAMVSTFGAIFSPKSDVKPQHLSGAVGIMRIYYVLFESEHGWRHAIWFSVILNVNLALLNLLPIPVLDGGHILLALIEAFRRRPVGTRLLYAVQNTCAVLLIGYMVYLTIFDVQDLPWKRHKAPEIKFAPKNANPAPVTP